MLFFKNDEINNDGIYKRAKNGTSERFNWVSELRNPISLGMVIILLLLSESTVRFFSTHISGGTISIF